MKEYKCVEVKNHNDIGKVIAEYQNNGWILHTYQATGLGQTVAYAVNHYLLFEKGK